MDVQNKGDRPHIVGKKGKRKKKKKKILKSIIF